MVLARLCRNTICRSCDVKIGTFQNDPRARFPVQTGRCHRAEAQVSKAKPGAPGSKSALG